MNSAITKVNKIAARRIYQIIAQRGKEVEKMAPKIIRQHKLFVFLVILVEESMIK